MVMSTMNATNMGMVVPGTIGAIRVRILASVGPNERMAVNATEMSSVSVDVGEWAPCTETKDKAPSVGLFGWFTRDGEAFLTLLKLRLCFQIATRNKSVVCLVVL